MSFVRFVGFIGILLISKTVVAQVFDGVDFVKSNNIYDAGKSVSEDVSERKDKAKADGQKNLLNLGSGTGDDAALRTKKTEDEDVFIPAGELYRLNTPTYDGSERGGQAFVEVDEKGRMKKAEKIFLYYDNFKVTNYLSKSTTCDVRFNILSNLDRKITQLDIKLVWPDLTTTLSFSDVMPNTQTYYNYSLLGKGCYNMDKAPNIVVNRCRVRGMTASECANKLLWVSK